MIFRIERPRERPRRPPGRPTGVRAGRRNTARAPELAGFLEQYVEDRKSELSPGALELHAQTGRYLSSPKAASA